MNTSPHRRTLIGSGTSAEIGRAGTVPHWRPDEDSPPVEDESTIGHPAGYFADADLVDAVNTALLLNKPLLLTGNPGTGKTELAQRIAWEFGISPVLRFEAQSLSEANDLFYRFDLVRHVAASHTARPAGEGEPPNADPRKFVSFGPLGKAILRANPDAAQHQGLWTKAFPGLPLPQQGEASVVLIDEIDKASRDFPNDLLNAIERLTVPVRELDTRLSVGTDASLRPIIVVTSNLERELPDPFLRRCVYHHISDPEDGKLRKIVRARVFPESLTKDPPKWLPPGDRLPELFEEMLGFFLQQRDDPKTSFVYKTGPSELIDWSTAVRSTLDPLRRGEIAGGIGQNLSVVRQTFSALAKNRDDRNVLLGALGRRHTPA